MATKDKPVEAPVEEQCEAVNDDGVRCLFVVHEGDEHAFTEEAAEAAEAPEAAPDPEAAPEANGEPPEAQDEAPEGKKRAVAPLRESVNSWWCGKKGCDTAMGHDVSVCSTCHTPRT